jgi:uncharacterized membrane protein YbhN (UPF0104 family)
VNFVVDMIQVHHPLYRGTTNIFPERRKGCSCIGVLVTLIIIGSLILVILILDSDVFFYGVPQEVRNSAFNDLLSIVVLLILLLPIVAIVTWFLNRERPIPEDM